MKKILCLISSPPGSAQVGRGLVMAYEWLKKGHSVAICLLQDGVYSGLDGREIFEDKITDAEWFVLADDLQLRGFSAQDLRAGVQTTDYSNLIKMIMGDADQVLGAF